MMLPASEQTRYSLFPLFLAGAAFVLLASLFWRSSTLPEGKQIARAYENADLYHRVYPQFHYGFGRLRAGQLPLWNPGQLCGTPFLANPATAVFQPVNAVFLLMATERAMAVQTLLCLFLMGGLFALYLRSLDLRHVSAVIGGVIYAFSGSSAAAMTRPELAAALAWTPLVFWAIRESPRRQNFGGAVLGGVGVALVILSGAPALSAVMLVFAAAYAVLRTVVGSGKGGAGRFRLMTGFGLMGLLGVALSAVQWAPSAAWFLLLDAPMETLLRVDLAGQLPSQGRDVLAQFLKSSPGVLPRVGYLGIAPLILVPAAFFHGRGRAEAFFFTGAAVFLFPVATQGALWFWDSFAYEVLLFPASFCVAVVAALGADRFLTARRDSDSPRTWVPVALVLSSAGALFYVGSAEVRGRIVAVAVVLLVFAIFRLRWLGAVCGVVLAVLLFVDLSKASVNHYGHPFSDAPVSYAAHNRALRAAKGQALGGRVLVSAHLLHDALSPNIGMVSSVPAVGGAYLPLLKAQGRWWQELGPGATYASGLDVSPQGRGLGLLRYMAARVFLAAEGGALAQSEWSLDGLRRRVAPSVDELDLYVYDGALPRAYWVPGWRLVADEGAAIRLLTGEDFDGRKTCVIEQRPGLPEAVAAACAAESPSPVPPQAVCCVLAEELPERVTLQVDAPQPGISVLADTFTPGWRATVDGVGTPILRTNGMFRGVYTPAGKHTVVFVYRPLWFRLGLALSVGTLVLLVFWGRGVLQRGS